MLFSPTLGPGGQKARGPIQCVGRASLPIGVNDGERGKQDDKVGKGGNKTTKGGKGETRRQKKLTKPVPRAAVAYGRQLKNGKSSFLQTKFK